MVGIGPLAIPEPPLPGMLGAWSSTASTKHLSIPSRTPTRGNNNPPKGLWGSIPWNPLGGNPAERTHLVAFGVSQFL